MQLHVISVGPYRFTYMASGMAARQIFSIFTGMTSPEKRIFLRSRGTLYASTFVSAAIQMAETAQMMTEILLSSSASTRSFGIMKQSRGMT